MDQQIKKIPILFHFWYREALRNPITEPKV